MTEKIILVDQNDNQVGEGEKLSTHQKGLLHRAFSVFVFRKRGDKKEVLLQQRNRHKYHSGGLWTNTCCGHPRNGETTRDAAERRLFEEMGFRISLEEIGHFHYTATLDHDLIEHEIDHIFISEADQIVIQPDPKEVEDFAWIEFEDLQKDIELHPKKYTA